MYTLIRFSVGRSSVYGDTDKAGILVLYGLLHVQTTSLNAIYNINVSTCLDVGSSFNVEKTIHYVHRKRQSGNGNESIKVYTEPNIISQFFPCV